MGLETTNRIHPYDSQTKFTDKPDLNASKKGKKAHLTKGYYYDEKGNIVDRNKRIVNTSAGYCDKFRLPAILLSVLAVVPTLVLFFGIDLTIEYGDGLATEECTFYEMICNGWGLSILSNEMLTIIFWIAVAISVIGIIHPYIGEIEAFILIILGFMLRLPLSNDLWDIITYEASLSSSVTLAFIIIGIIVGFVCSFVEWCAERYGRQFVTKNISHSKLLSAFWLGRCRFGTSQKNEFWRT